MSYLNQLFNLQGKVAVIIGGTGELCGHMATGLAQAGVQVVLVGRSQAKADEKLANIKELGGDGYFVSADVSDKSSMTNVLEAVLAQSGRVDILINGAGVNSATPVLDIELDEFQRIININVGAILQSCQVFAKHWLAENKQGNIINLGSISGLNPLSRVFSYSASKAAVHNLSKNLAREWANQGIRVNTLVPGFFPAEQNKAVLDESRITSILNHTPMERFGNPQELIGATLLLASDSAGSFITGHEMVVDGGFRSMMI